MIDKQGTMHPEGCMCQSCIEEREMEEDVEEVVPVQKPPVIQQPPRPRGRPRKTPVYSNPPRYPESYTQPVEPPRDNHSRYEYSRGEMRRCHLCGAHESHMNFDNGDEPVWFASLEDRARHILEIHTDASNPIIKMERQRAKEILGIKDVWDRHAEGKLVMVGKPQMEDMHVSSPTSNTPIEPKKSILSGLIGSAKKQDTQKGDSGNSGSWFMQHKLISVIIVLAVLYGLYVIYLMSQGYEF
jgi:hypothetical protein